MQNKSRPKQNFLFETARSLRRRAAKRCGNAPAPTPTNEDNCVAKSPQMKSLKSVKGFKSQSISTARKHRSKVECNQRQSNSHFQTQIHSQSIHPISPLSPISTAEIHSPQSQSRSRSIRQSESRSNAHSRSHKQSHTPRHNCNSNPAPIEKPQLTVTEANSRSEPLPFANRRKLSKAAIIDEFAVHSAKVTLNPAYEPMPRVIFVSIFYLAQEWNQIPMPIIYDSIFCFNIPREWVFPDDKKSAPLSIDDKKLLVSKRYAYLGKVRSNRLFLDMLLIKEKQGLVLWNTNSHNTMSGGVDKGWKSISDQLAKMWDPITGMLYNPLISDIEYWVRLHPSKLHFCYSMRQIVEELMFFRFTYNATCEIMCRSNPTLIPIVKFNRETYCQCVKSILQPSPKIDDGYASLSVHCSHRSIQHSSIHSKPDEDGFVFC